MMWGFGSGSSMMGSWGPGPIFMILFWLLVAIAAVASLVWLVRPARPHDAGGRPSRSSNLDILEERYARGDISRDEYLQKRRDITG